VLIARHHDRLTRNPDDFARLMHVCGKAKIKISLYTGGELDLSAWRDFPDVVDVYLYGKREARRGRKMGHFVTHADTPERALARAQLFRARLEVK